jgi:hypothetical protein
MTMRHLLVPILLTLPLLAANLGDPAKADMKAWTSRSLKPNEINTFMALAASAIED